MYRISLLEWKSIGIILCLISIVFLSFTPATVKYSTGDDPIGTLADILASGEIMVGADIAYPPFEDYNLTTGEPEGFDVDLMQEIATYLSSKYNQSIGVDFIPSVWDSIIPNLKAKQFDVICSAMTITAAREAEVDFTRWYYQSAMGVLVPTANPKGITTLGDLNKTELIIGFHTGTTTYIWAQANLNDTVPTRLLTYDDFPLAIAALRMGQVDAVMGDVAVLNLEAAQIGDVKIDFSFHGFQPENFGIACRTGDEDLRAALNEAIDHLLGSDVGNSTISTIYKRYLLQMAWHKLPRNTPN